MKRSHRRALVVVAIAVLVIPGVTLLFSTPPEEGVNIGGALYLLIALAVSIFVAQVFWER